MSARLIAQDREQKYMYTPKNIENEKNNLNQDYLRDITPKKINFLPVSTQRNIFPKEEHVTTQGTIGKISVFKNSLLNDATPKKGEQEKQRQMAKIKEFYEDKIQKMEKEYKRVIFCVEEERKKEAEEKNYWKQATMKIKQQLEQKASLNMTNQCIQPLMKNARDQKCQGDSIQALEQEVQKLTVKNSDLQVQIQKIKDKNRNNESKLRIVENSLKTAESFIKHLKNKQHTKKQMSTIEIKPKSPLKNSSGSFSGISPTHHKSDSSHHHRHSSHHRTIVRPSSHSGDLQKQLDRCKNMGQRMAKNIEQTNEQLVKQKLKNLNSKYAKYV